LRACAAEITKANDEVIKVMNLYDEVINKADIGSLLVEDNHGKLFPALELLVVSVATGRMCLVLRHHENGV